MLQSGLSVVANHALPIVYGDLRIACAYRMDFVVEDQVVIELKSVMRLEKIHVSQLLTYLKLSGYHVGLLINFNVSVLQHGIRRVMNDPPS
jgi:GxxExxY protein